MTIKTRKKKIVSVVGARPQFIKAAILRRAFDKHAAIDEIMIHTGQHFDDMMSDVFFNELEIRKPDHAFDIHGGGHGQMTGRMLEAIESVLDAEKPEACLVYGDTNSTLAGALAAAKMHIPVFHVEAGLRSFNKKMPEEINRIMTDHVSDLLFCSSFEGLENLHNENITNGVLHTGDIMYDAVLHIKRSSASIRTVGGVDLNGNPIAACTLHRAENTDKKERLESIVAYLNDEADGLEIVLPLHPRTKNALEKFNVSLGNIRAIEPLGYRDMQALLGASEMVFTDSGGLQKEAYFHGKPCVTLRDETEWVELIEHGWNRLWNVPDYKPRRPIAEYGEGNAGKKIVKEIEQYFFIELV